MKDRLELGTIYGFGPSTMQRSMTGDALFLDERAIEGRWTGHAVSQEIVNHPRFGPAHATLGLLALIGLVVYMDQRIKVWV